MPARSRISAPVRTSSCGTRAARRSRRIDGALRPPPSMTCSATCWNSSTAHLGSDVLTAVGHRVVHGGSALHAPAQVDDALLRQLDALVPLAPLHEPQNVAPIRTLARLRPGLPQVACFDTAFHHTMPAIATRYALPRRPDRSRHPALRLPRPVLRLHRRAVGGGSPELARGRVIVAHLGNGASLCAMRDGRSIDTTMGFTALDGLVMGTRCGAIDPGVLLYLQQSMGMTVGDIETLLYRKSGLLGVSGLSSDMRELHESDEPRARDAIVAVLVSDRARNRRAGGVAGRPGRLRLHGRHRRARPGRSGRGLRAARLARGRARPRARTRAAPRSSAGRRARSLSI